MIENRPSDTFQPHTLLNNTYRVEGILGRGGTSEVYRARSEISNRVVAIKVLKSEFSGNEDYLLLMKREEEIREIRHDAIVRYSENHRTVDGHVYLVMDFVDGPGLDEKLRSGGLPAEDLMIIGARIADGLYAAHARNIVHRDLSPDNIILRDDKPTEAVIIDFGIAKDSNPGAGTIVGNEFAGKYAYAAPEQLNGTSDARSDIYALGALLLATFRGETPNVGRNPMEVIAKKGEPLDTEGVPEPLKSLIDRMTQPNPDDRFQSVNDLLDEIDPGYQQTVIGARPISVVPRPSADPASLVGIPEAAPEISAKPQKEKGGKGLVIALVLLVVAGGAGGLYLSGALSGEEPVETARPQLPPEETVASAEPEVPPPAAPERAVAEPAEPAPVTSEDENYPPADPYTLIGEHKQGQVTRLIGNAPSVRIRDALMDIVEEKDGVAAIELASGDLIDGWGDEMVSLIQAVSELTEWRFIASGNLARVTGKTSDPKLAERIEAAFSTGEMADGLVGSAQIEITGDVLPRASVQAVIDRFADCGPLFLPQSPALGYGEGADIVVAGTMSSAARRDELAASLQGVAGARPVRVQTSILSTSLCRIDQSLPNVPSAGIEIVYRYGGKDDRNTENTYFVGENPVMDIILPAQITDGYLWASIIDVTGSVYHLLPNERRSDNSVASLRNGIAGPVPLRLTYPVEDATTPDRIAFVVDDSALGTGRLVVFLSSEPVFPTNRPAAEPVDAFADALEAAEAGAAIKTLDSRLLITTRP